MKCLLLTCFMCLAAITVVVADPPRLEIQPHSSEITKEVGNSLALTCMPIVQGPEYVTQLEWLDPKNRVIDNMNPESAVFIQKLNNEAGSMLIFSKLSESLAGEYTCRGNYANTPLKATIKVNIIVDITWVDAPENQYPTAGRDYLVRCDVRANPGPILDWVRNGVAINTSKKYVIETKGLLIKDVNESDDGIYTCRAVVVSTGRFGSRNIKVEVLVPPKISPIVANPIVEGEQASMQCTAASKPPSTYTWIKIDSREDLSKKDRFSVNKNTGLMLISKVEIYDDSQYKCVAENHAGIDEMFVNITVLMKPQIYEFLNVTAPINNNTRIICKTRGRPVPTVLFRKLSNELPFQIGQQENDGRLILEQRIEEGKDEAFGVLSIERLNRTDDGLYECIASNNIGAAYKNGHITVEFPPTFEKTRDYPPVYAWSDRAGNLTCIAESIPNATVKWRLNEIDIVDGPSLRIEGRGPVSSLIVTPHNQRQFFARYECIASNRLGEARQYIELREAKVPEPVQQVLVDTVTATTIKFNIVGPQYEKGLPLRSFIVQFQTERERTWDTARNKTWSVNAPYIIENLVPQETYNFRFAAANDVGTGGYNGPTVHYTMPMRSVPAEPKIITLGPQYDGGSQDVILNSPYADHFELRWNVPHDNGDPIINYNIRYCVTQKINGEWRDSETECSAEINQSSQYQSYELNNLLPDTTYKIELRANNAIGLSSPAQIRVKTTRGLDSMMSNYDGPTISSALIVGIVVAAIVLILIVVDITCCYVNRTGILAYICDCIRSKRVDEEDPKLGSYKAAPAHPNSLNLPQPIKLAHTPTDEKEPLSPENRDQPQMIIGDRRNLSVEFDGKQVHTKPIEIGRYSAV